MAALLIGGIFLSLFVFMILDSDWQTAISVTLITAAIIVAALLATNL